MNGHIDLRIDSIRDLEFFLLTSDDVSIAQLGIQFEAIDLVAYGSSKTVAITTEVRYTQNYDKENALLILKYTNEMTFYIDNFDDVFRLENEKYLFNKKAIHILLNIIIPTVRGILYTKTAGTNLAKGYLPLIVVDQVINNSSVFT